jgi:quercetin dioxygenase-like cupin family protein
MRRPHLFLFVLVPSLAAVSSIVAPSARAQDPVAVNPAIAKIELENDRIRVLRVHYQPHQKFAMHEHPAKVAVCLTEFHTRRLASDGTLSEGTCPAGTVVWREPEKHAVENLDDTPAETIEIELKYAHAPAAAVPVGGGIPADPLEIDLEPHHHVLFKNQYVEVMDVRIDPGDTTAYHTHAHDTVFIHLSDSVTQSQTKDKDWDPALPSKPGDVAFDKDSQHPFTHHVKNAGAGAFHVLDIELHP